jgi:hypothetical protein
MKELIKTHNFVKIAASLLDMEERMKEKRSKREEER